jgi:hypothetical protein
MKTSKKQKPEGDAALNLRSLATKAAVAEKAADVARKKVRLTKARFKAARKAFKNAKRTAKQARKAAKAAACAPPQKPARGSKPGKAAVKGIGKALPKSSTAPPLPAKPS